MLVSVLADSLETLNPVTDTTLALAQSACRRGDDVFFFAPHDLFALEDRVFAEGFSLKKKGQTLCAEGRVSLDLNRSDVLLIRHDPPVTMPYLTPLYLLGRLTCSVLNPVSVLQTVSEKLSILEFPRWIPPTCVSSSLSFINAFIQKHGLCVVKPLFGCAGQGVRIVEKDLDEMFESTLMVQSFLPEVYQGDFRILFFFGEPVGIFRRLPQDGNFLCNLAQGGCAQKASFDEISSDLLKDISLYLLKHKIAIAGVDVIGDRLIEINLTSPTGFHSVQELSGISLADVFWKMFKERSP